MKTNKVWLVLPLAALALLGLLSGCAGAPAAGGTTAPADTGGTQIANPWVDATAADAAKVLGGTMYNVTTLGSDWEQYALLVTTSDAVQKGSLPTAWVRFRKGGEDVSLQMVKGGKLSAEQLNGKQVPVNGVPAYIVSNSASGSISQIAWENGGLLFEISASSAMSDDALTVLAQGVKAEG